MPRNATKTRKTTTGPKAAQARAQREAKAAEAESAAKVEPVAEPEPVAEAKAEAPVESPAVEKLDAPTAAEAVEATNGGKKSPAKALKNVTSETAPLVKSLLELVRSKIGDVEEIMSPSGADLRIRVGGKTIAYVSAAKKQIRVETIGLALADLPKKLAEADGVKELAGPDRVQALVRESAEVARTVEIVAAGAEKRAAVA